MQMLQAQHGQATVKLGPQHADLGVQTIELHAECLAHPAAQTTPAAAACSCPEHLPWAKARMHNLLPLCPPRIPRLPWIRVDVAAP